MYVRIFGVLGDPDHFLSRGIRGKLGLSAMNMENGTFHSSWNGLLGWRESSMSYGLELLGSACCPQQASEELAGAWLDWRPLIQQPCASLGLVVDLRLLKGRRDAEF